MSTDYDELKSQYPSVISADQFRQICHISKRKAKWLLENDVIPCKDSGKKTRRFTIKMDDVIEFLKKQTEGNLKIMPPPGIFTTRPSSINANGVSMLPSTDFLNNQWKQMPDVLRTEQVAHMLGYTRSTVVKWIRIGQLEAVSYQQSYLIPKEWLIDYIVRTVCNGKNFKSKILLMPILNCQTK